MEYKSELSLLTQSTSSYRLILRNGYLYLVAAYELNSLDKVFYLEEFYDAYQEILVQIGVSMHG